MNRILSAPPDLTPATFVFGSPPWLVIGIRCFLLFAGVITAFLCAQQWSVMPLFARLMAALIAPSLIAGSVWPRPWRNTARFIANESGIYFPAYPALTLSSSKSEIGEQWLGVPWESIANIRIATESGEDGKCIAFDIQVSASEKAKFFQAVGIPRDRSESVAETVCAAYGGWPPSRSRAVRKLHSLSSQNEANPSR